MIEQHSPIFKIHTLSKEQYQAALSRGEIDENALYLTPNEMAEVDTELSESSENPVQNKAVAGKIKAIEGRIDELEKTVEDLPSSGEGGNITVDSELSTESENPVQNKIIAAEINKINSKTVISSEEPQDAAIGTLWLDTSSTIIAYVEGVGF